MKSSDERLRREERVLLASDNERLRMKSSDERLRREERVLLASDNERLIK
jgi:hypothetical protein